MSSGPKSSIGTPLKLTVVVIAMFGFGFALIPLYNVICDVTGLNGKTGVVDAQKASTYEVDENREIVVEFVANLNQSMDWAFRPTIHKMVVHPGKVYSTEFFARNDYPVDMVGQAVPSVMPNVASRYFSKTECFCFTNQKFKAGEEKNMPVSFIIDPAIPGNVHTVTLSYTFFDVTQTAMKNSNSN